MNAAQFTTDFETSYQEQKARDLLQSRKMQRDKQRPLLGTLKADVERYLSVLTSCRDACLAELVEVEAKLTPNCDRFEETRLIGLRADLQDSIVDCESGYRPNTTQGTRLLLALHDAGIRPPRGAANVFAGRPRGIRRTAALIESIDADIARFDAEDAEYTKFTEEHGPCSA